LTKLKKKKKQSLPFGDSQKSLLHPRYERGLNNKGNGPLSHGNEFTTLMMACFLPVPNFTFLGRWVWKIL
jgi:hypothetical protein